MIFPVRSKDAITTAQCLFIYFCTYGLCDIVRTDPGSDFTSEVFSHLLRWLGPTRSLTLVDNPQADGVEGTNKQILRHLKALCWDERVKENWSDPSVYPIIQLVINEQINSETGIVPLHAHFGDLDSLYLQIPDIQLDRSVTHKYVVQLSDHLAAIRQASAEYQSKLKQKRVSSPHPESANTFKPGDLVIVYA